MQCNKEKRSTCFTKEEVELLKEAFVEVLVQDATLFESSEDEEEFERDVNSGEPYTEHIILPAEEDYKAAKVGEEEDEDGTEEEGEVETPSEVRGKKRKLEDGESAGNN